MDEEQRIKAYVNLVEQLLASPREVNRIIDRHQELLDTGFVIFLKEKAKRMENWGEEQKAYFLRSIASFLSENIINSPYTAPPNADASLQFLMQVLKTTDDSQGDPQKIYLLLKAHQDKLTLSLADVLRQWGSRTLAIVDSIQGYYIAVDIANFSNLMQQLQLGNRSSNVEIAIAGYQTILSVFTRRVHPKDWAMVQLSLGTAYTSRILGDRAENLEQAIKCYKVALEVLTRSAYPPAWASTQLSLGTAYLYRIVGERAENLETGISTIQSVLEVFTYENSPQEWAKTQNNLGTAYLFRIRGERKENIEQAIELFKAALKVRNRENFPAQWAGIQMNLGTSYRHRILGKREENLETAIQCYQAALQVRTRETSPQDWAEAKNNLATAYADRILGEKADNLEKTIACYQAALQVYTRTDFPEDWARTQIGLGAAYQTRTRGDRAENIERAIACLQEALQVYIPNAFPEMWAMTQHNLGNAYLYRIRGYQKDNRKQAIASYRAALTIYTPSSFPQDCLRTGQSLGDLGYSIQNWEIAIEGYHQAILAIEQSRYWATSEATKRELIANSLNIYQKMVQACINHQDYAQALLTVERSKSRTLIELLDSAHLYPKNATDAQKQRISDLRRQIAMYQQQLAYTSRDTLTPTTEKHPNQPSPESIRQQLQAANQQFQDLLTELDDPNFTLTQQVPPQLPDLRRLLSPQTALIEWYLPTEAESGFYAFLVTHQNDQIQITPHPFSAEDRQHLDQAIEDYRSNYGQPTWNDRLPQRLETLSDALQLPRILGELSQIQQLILIPHRELHLIPLHALPVSLPSPSGGEGKPLQDCFPVQYAPSCQILNNLQQRPPLNGETVPFFAIQNPTEDLNYAEWGVELLRRQFSPHQVLRRHQATLDNLTQPQTQTFLEQSHAVHFGCHGEFDDRNPLNAYLRLANQDKLTFLDIFNCLNIPLCRLLVLSACKTGLVETSHTDDYVGLSSAFFYAGARTVVASLWNVDELAATLVTLRLYQILPDYPSVTVALQAAQTWLRGLSSADVLDWLKHDQKATQEEVEAVEARLDLFEHDPPFAEACYWSAFTATGL